MRINPMNNVQLTRPNFGKLVLRENSNFDEAYLSDFVHNTEVLKFVKYFDDCGIDVEVDGHGKSGMALYGKDKNGNEKFFYGLYGSKDRLKDFKAMNVVNEIIKTAKEKIAAIPKMEEAHNFVELFNRALEINAEKMASNNFANETQFEKKILSQLKK